MTTMATHCIARNCSQLTAYTSKSAARAFLLLAPRRYLHSPPLPMLDFLLPSLFSRTIQHGWTSKPNSHHAQKHVKRPFTFSARRQGTTTILNPRKDDEGKDMNIEITPRASNRLKEIMDKDQNPNLALRIQVESGGCHGFQYVMSLTTLPPLDSSNPSSPPKESSPASSTSSMDPNEMPSRCTKNHNHKISEEAMPALNTSSQDSNALSSKRPGLSPSPEDWSKKEEDNKGTGLGEDDTVFATENGAGAKVVMDGPSLELLKGSKVDYTMELIGSQFKIVDNPLATSSCGCGTSFDIKA